MFEVKVTISADAQLAALLAAIAAGLGSVVPAPIPPVQETPVKKMTAKEKTQQPEAVETDGVEPVKPEPTGQKVDVTKFNETVVAFAEESPENQAKVKKMLAERGLRKVSAVPAEDRAAFLAELQKPAA